MIWPLCATWAAWNWLPLSPQDVSSLIWLLPGYRRIVLPEDLRLVACKQNWPGRWSCPLPAVLPCLPKQPHGHGLPRAHRCVQEQQELCKSWLRCSSPSGQRSCVCSLRALDEAFLVLWWSYFILDPNLLVFYTKLKSLCNAIERYCCSNIILWSQACQDGIKNTQGPLNPHILGRHNFSRFSCGKLQASNLECIWSYTMHGILTDRNCGYIW